MKTKLQRVSKPLTDRENKENIKHEIAKHVNKIERRRVNVTFTSEKKSRLRRSTVREKRSKPEHTLFTPEKKSIFRCSTVRNGNNEIRIRKN